MHFHPVSTVRGYVRRASTVSKDKGGDGLIKKDWTRVVNRTYKAAAKRFRQVTSKRRPMTIEILKRIKSQLKHESHNDRAIWAILCLGVFTLARIRTRIPYRATLRPTTNFNRLLRQRLRMRIYYTIPFH